MPVGLGPRFLIEAGFIVAVAVIAGIARLDTWTIVLVMAVAWLLVVAAEWFAAHSRRTRTAQTERAPAVEPAVWAEPRRVVAPPPPRALEPEPQPAPEVTPQPIPEPTPEPEPEPEQPPAEPEQTPAEPEPQQPRVQLAPPPPPEPPTREPAPQVVSITSRVIGPREWNLWDLERIARDAAGSDVARDEERSYILMYLRDFANADGIIPADFDTVVRESFGDALDAAYSS